MLLPQLAHRRHAHLVRRHMSYGDDSCMRIREPRDLLQQVAMHQRNNAISTDSRHTNSPWECALYKTAGRITHAPHSPVQKNRLPYAAWPIDVPELAPNEMPAARFTRCGCMSLCMYVCVCLYQVQVQVFTQRPRNGRIKLCNCANREV
jgi:hypothetical protein